VACGVCHVGFDLAVWLRQLLQISVRRPLHPRAMVIVGGLTLYSHHPEHGLGGCGKGRGPTHWRFPTYTRVVAGAAGATTAVSAFLLSSAGAASSAVVSSLGASCRRHGVIGFSRCRGVGTHVVVHRSVGLGAHGLARVNLAQCTPFSVAAATVRGRVPAAGSQAVNHWRHHWHHRRARHPRRPR
jgi:hypothetical protein